ncbi:hypothetical protein N7E02_08025 [Aliirhizobium terrae]|uniref:hypothetical protein n=1 Tax=Terrirhizobium terrae TaxID=2926709 RepID=UPI0025757195|nr:hypothetical protein [Rhizobium sp. CC-CFT758]WJH40555.1 hypothetical protein N7E02_08025 [Rhizobium sp. CC-CFT758]
MIERLGLQGFSDADRNGVRQLCPKGKRQDCKNRISGEAKKRSVPILSRVRSRLFKTSYVMGRRAEETDASIASGSAQFYCRELRSVHLRSRHLIVADATCAGCFLCDRGGVDIRIFDPVSPKRLHHVVSAMAVRMLH